MKVAHLYLKIKIEDKVESKHILKILREHHVIIKEHLMQILTEEQDERLNKTKNKNADRSFFQKARNAVKRFVNYSRPANQIRYQSS